ncbi:hypothetical protein JG688_00014821 [Phytophthora aleatoria]|uniref:RxLR effector protein n=1 Tax=Phytophthora aleatoria TaxID=2496075 RepID=A0A8J5MDR6_9STRA|nr:hypothetical protein JG688_00014821 [Phytophthora aleatoria]
MRFSLFLILVMTTFTMNCFNIAYAKEEVTLTLLDDVVEGTAAKINQSPSKLRGGVSAATTENAIVKFQGAGQLVTTSAKNWDDAVDKIKSGAKLKPLDTASGKWKGDFEKLKAAGQFKDVDEKQFVKLTENIAQEVVKNPSKWRGFKKALEITYGVGLAALIGWGLISMTS